MMDTGALEYVTADVDGDVTCGRSGQVELLVRCEDLVDLDIFSKSDPMCVLFGRQFGQWRELGRTEAVDDTFNPRFTETFLLKYDVGPSNSIKFAVYDIDCKFGYYGLCESCVCSIGEDLWASGNTGRSKSADLSKHDFVGSVETSLSSLVQPDTKITQTLYTLRAPGDPKGRGQIIIMAEMVRPTRSRMLLHLGATKLNKTGMLHLSKRSTCLEICRSVSESKFHPIHRTEIVHKCQDPRWRPCELSVQKLCNGDPDRILQIVCWHIKDNNEQHFSGSTITSLRELTKQKKLCEVPLMKSKKGDKKKTPHVKGYIRFLQSRLDMAFTVRDYVQGGCSLRYMLAIDFTSSNGDPSCPTSLHHLGAMDNEYLEAIKTLGGLLSHYDMDQDYAVFGFGAKTNPKKKTKHCFTLNGRRNNPFCRGPAGVLEAYRSAVGRLTLGGPSLLAPVLREATNLALQHPPTQSAQQYWVLMVVTDGVVNDIDDTVDALIASCAAPLSVVIVGIGPADFSTMEDLLRYNPDQLLTSVRTGESATRSNVHFAAIRKDRYIAGANTAVGREALATVSRQMVAYLGDRGISPNNPSIHRTDPTLGSWVGEEDVMDSTRHVMTGTLTDTVKMSPSCSSLGPTCPTCGSHMEAEMDPILHITTDAISHTLKDM